MLIKSTLWFQFLKMKVDKWCIWIGRMRRIVYLKNWGLPLYCGYWGNDEKSIKLPGVDDIDVGHDDICISIVTAIPERYLIQSIIMPFSLLIKLICIELLNSCY